MKVARLLRYVVLPALALGAGVKLGIKYAEDHYVIKDKKFIEGKIVRESHDKR